MEKQWVAVWHKATIQGVLDSGAVDVTDDDPSAVQNSTDSCWRGDGDGFGG